MGRFAGLLVLLLAAPSWGAGEVQVTECEQVVPGYGTGVLERDLYCPNTNPVHIEALEYRFGRRLFASHFGMHAAKMGRERVHHVVVDAGNDCDGTSTCPAEDEEASRSHDEAGLPARDGSGNPNSAGVIVPPSR